MKISPTVEQLFSSGATLFTKSPSECFDSVVSITTNCAFQYPYVRPKTTTGGLKVHSEDDGLVESQKNTSTGSDSGGERDCNLPNHQKVQSTPVSRITKDISFPVSSTPMLDTNVQSQIDYQPRTEREHNFLRVLLGGPFKQQVSENLPRDNPHLVSLSWEDSDAVVKIKSGSIPNLSVCSGSSSTSIALVPRPADNCFDRY